MIFTDILCFLPKPWFVNLLGWNASLENISGILFMCCVQFDFVKLLDGKALPRSLTDPISNAKTPKGLLLSGLQETGFIEYMDPGTWHLALYNDGRNLEQVLLHSTPIGECNIHFSPSLCSVHFAQAGCERSLSSSSVISPPCFSAKT